MPKYLHWRSHFSASPPPVTCRPLESRSDTKPKLPQTPSWTKAKIGYLYTTLIVAMSRHYYRHEAAALNGPINRDVCEKKSGNINYRLPSFIVGPSPGILANVFSFAKDGPRPCESAGPFDVRHQNKGFQFLTGLLKYWRWAGVVIFRAKYTCCVLDLIINVCGIWFGGKMTFSNAVCIFGCLLSIWRIFFEDRLTETTFLDKLL